MQLSKHPLDKERTFEATSSLSMFTQGKSSLSFGQFCASLRLIVDTLAWRLQATGVLGLPTPPVSVKFIGFIHETLER